MNIMLVHSSSKNFSMLRREDFKIIGDIASNYEFFLYRDYFAVNVKELRILIIGSNCFFCFQLIDSLLHTISETIEIPEDHV